MSDTFEQKITTKGLEAILKWYNKNKSPDVNTETYHDHKTAADAIRLLERLYIKLHTFVVDGMGDVDGEEFTELVRVYRKMAIGMVAKKVMRNRRIQTGDDIDDENNKVIQVTPTKSTSVAIATSTSVPLEKSESEENPLIKKRVVRNKDRSVEMSSHFKNGERSKGFAMAHVFHNMNKTIVENELIKDIKTCTICKQRTNEDVVILTCCYSIRVCKGCETDFISDINEFFRLKKGVLGIFRCWSCKQVFNTDALIESADDFFLRYWRISLLNGKSPRDKDELLKIVTWVCEHEEMPKDDHEKLLNLIGEREDVKKRLKRCKQVEIKVDELEEPKPKKKKKKTVKTIEDQPSTSTGPIIIIKEQPQPTPSIFEQPIPIDEPFKNNPLVEIMSEPNNGGDFADFDFDTFLEQSETNITNIDDKNTSAPSQDHTPMFEDDFDESHTTPDPTPLTPKYVTGDMNAFFNNSPFFNYG